MKRISKIRSVLMVVAMLFTIAAVPASALELDDSATIKYVFKDGENGNVITSAEKGDVVWLYVVLNWNKNVLNFQGTFKWDKDVLTLVRKNGKVGAVTSTTQTFNLCGDFATSTQVALTDADGDMFTQDDENNMMGYYTTYGAGSKTFNHNATIAAWDDAKKAQYQAYTFIYTSNLDDTTNQLLVNTKGQDVEFCQMCFQVNEDTDLTEAVISNDDAFSIMNYIDVTNDQSWFFVPYAKTSFSTYAFNPTDATLNIGTAPSVVVTHEGTQSKWVNGTPVAADYLFGFLGKVSGLTLETKLDEATGKTEVTNIQSITATATINGEIKTADVQTVWAAGEGYMFRAAFAGFTPDMTDSVSVTFAITMSDGTTVYETADAATATINGIYTTSVGNGLAALAA